MPSNRQQTQLVFVIVAIATLVAYLPALGAGFVWDDDAYVEANETLQTFGGILRIWFEPLSIPQYYPLVHSTFWLEYRLWGTHPFGFHLDNLLLHLVACGLLVALVRRLAIPGALLVGSVFALHPVMVESVAWVTERKNVLSMVFYLSSALAYCRWAGLDSAPAADARRQRTWWLALALFVLALASKSVTFSLPFALLLITYWRRGTVTARDLWPLLPFILVGVGYGLLTSYLEHVHVGANGPEFDDSWLDKCLVAGRTPWFYLSKLLWPYRLVFIYERWEIDPTQLWQWGFPVATISVVAILIGLRSRLGRGPLTAVLMFGGTLFPALGFITVFPFRYSYVADHFQYHASLGILVASCAVATRWTKRLPRAVALGLAVVVLGLYGTKTFTQCQKYADRETLFDSILHDVPDSWFAHNNLAAIYVVRGELARGLRFYTKTKQLNPKLDPGPAVKPEAYAHCMTGKMLANKYTLRDALAEFDAGRRATDPATRSRHLQAADRRRAALDPKIASVLDHFKRAYEISPGYVDALRDGGRVLQMWGMLTPDRRLSTTRLVEAVGLFERAVRADPADQDVRVRASNLHMELATGLARMGQQIEADAHLAAARRLHDEDPDSAAGQVR